ANGTNVAALMIGQEQAALDEGSCRVGGVKAFAERVTPNLRQHPPLPFSALAMDVAKAVRHRAGIRTDIWRIEPRIAVSLENAFDLFDSSADLGGIIPAPIDLPVAEDVGRGPH